MIVRFVKMCFHPENESSFEELFKNRKDKIASCDGCKSVELLKETKFRNEGTVYFTRSIWNSEEDLQQYRNSELFKDTWKRTKKLFSERAEAWSLEMVAQGQKK